METDTGVRPLLSRRGVIGRAGHKVGRPNCNTKHVVENNSIFSKKNKTKKTFSNSVLIILSSPSV